MRTVLADRIVMFVWRLRRLGTVEPGIFSSYFLCNRPSGRNRRSARPLHEMPAERTRSRSSPAYETTIDRGLYGALQEPQRLQAAGAGVDVPLTMTVDLEVNFGDIS
jgi:hypothetical protein